MTEVEYVRWGFSKAAPLLVRGVVIPKISLLNLKSPGMRNAALGAQCGSMDNETQTDVRVTLTPLSVRPEPKSCWVKAGRLTNLQET